MSHPIAAALLAASFTLSPRTAAASDPDQGDDALPFEKTDVSELVEHRQDAPDEPPPPSSRVMSPVGVTDPFPDRPPRVRPRSVALLLSLGVGLAGTGVVLARLSLLPDCSNRGDPLTCTIPDNGDLGFRGGRLVGAVAFGVGGAAFGALGGRALGQYLQQGPAGLRERRRRVAVGVGATSLALGVVGLVAGATMFGLGARGALDLASTFDSAAVGPADVGRLNQALTQVTLARAGLMTMVAAPTLIATGITLLRHRPRRTNLRVSPAISRSHFGLSISMRF